MIREKDGPARGVTPPSAKKSTPARRGTLLAEPRVCFLYKRFSIQHFGEEKCKKYVLKN